MVRAATLIALSLLVTPAVSQTTNTHCRWIGNIWSCDSQSSQPPSTAPDDQGSVLRSGAAIVPPYQPPSRPSPPLTAISPPINTMTRYGLDRDRIAMLRELIAICPRRDIDNVPLASLAPDQRPLIGALCFAFDEGRIDQILRSEK